jgi:hypothetical protein
MSIEAGNPKPIYMDNGHEEDGSGPRDEEENCQKRKQDIKVPKNSTGDKQDIKVPKNSTGGSASSGNKNSHVAGQGTVQALPTFLIHEPMGLGQEGSVAGPVGNSRDNLGMQSNEDNSAGRKEDGVVEDVHLGDESSQDDSMDTTELEMALKEWGDEEENSKLPSAEKWRSSLSYRLSNPHPSGASAELGRSTRWWELWSSVVKLSGMKVALKSLSSLF